MGVLSHALFLKGVDLDTFFEGSRQMVKIYNFLCTEAKTIREKVFMEEHGFKNEFDEYDEMVPHAVLFMEGCAVATGRLLPGERSGDFIIGRVAVLPEFRGRNLGAQIMLALEQEARRVGGKRISLSAQCRASGFYQTLGYREIGEAYLDEFCPHILMEKSL